MSDSIVTSLDEDDNVSVQSPMFDEPQSARSSASPAAAAAAASFPSPPGGIRPRTSAGASNSSASAASEQIKVMCRFRPENAQELAKGSTSDTFVEYVSSSTVDITLEGKKSSYTFDQIFPPESTQYDIYKAIGRDTVQSILDGYNAAVLSYGQTGSGRYTLNPFIQSFSSRHSDGHFAQLFLCFLSLSLIQVKLILCLVRATMVDRD